MQFAARQRERSLILAGSTFTILAFACNGEFTSSVAPLEAASVRVSPVTVTLPPGATQQFSARVEDQVGGQLENSIEWSASGGTITAEGLYTAGATPGSFQVSAIETTSGLGGTATVTISEESPPPPPPPPPPVGADEPVFDPGADISIFYENFETYANLAEVLDGSGAHDWGWRGTLREGTQATLLQDGGYDGARNLRLDYTPDPKTVGDYSMRMWPRVDFRNLTADVDPIIFSMWVKNTGGRLGKKRIAWYPDGPTEQRRFMFGISSVHAEPDALWQCWWEANWPFDPLDPEESPPNRVGYSFDLNEPGTNVAAYVANVNWSDWRDIYSNENDGEWHRHTWRITREGATPGTGRLEMWLDGHKILEYIGDDPALCSYRLVWTTVAGRAFIDGQSFEIGQTTSGGGTLNGGGYLFYDGIRIWTESQ